MYWRKTKSSQSAAPDLPLANNVEQLSWLQSGMQQMFRYRNHPFIRMRTHTTMFMSLHANHKYVEEPSQIQDKLKIDSTRHHMSLWGWKCDTRTSRAKFYNTRLQKIISVKNDASRFNVWDINRNRRFLSETVHREKVRPSSYTLCACCPQQYDNCAGKPFPNSMEIYDLKNKRYESYIIRLFMFGDAPTVSRCLYWKFLQWWAWWCNKRVHPPSYRTTNMHK